MARFSLLGGVLLASACGGEPIDFVVDRLDDAPIDVDGDGYSVESDCDDSDAGIHPDADEVCNDRDDDCDGSVDEDLMQTWYADADGDGWGDAEATISACAAPEGYAHLSGDCDDADARFHPGASESDCSDLTDYNCDGSVGEADVDGDGFWACEDCDDRLADVHPLADEICNDRDDDCNGTLDDDAVDAATWYTDRDGDGYGVDAEWIRSCDQPAATSAVAGDCDDGHTEISPAADEVCDGIDNDCSGLVDDDPADGDVWYADTDGDGFGDVSGPIRACEQLAGLVEDASDCDDTDADVNPDAQEICGGADDDCDGLVDDLDDSVLASVGGVAYYTDTDHDGYGLKGTGLWSCSKPSGRVANYKDCDDADSTVHPGVDEVCDDVDNDCDGTTDWGLRVPADQESISDAIDAASDGDTICVAAGTYTETIDFSGKSIELLGVEGAGSTVIDGNGYGPVVSFSSGEDSGAVLAGFTISGGSATNGAGIYVLDSDPTLQDVVISDNACEGTAATCRGVGLYCKNGAPTLSAAVVSSNLASTTPSSGTSQLYGGGIFLDGCDVVMDSVDLLDNVHGPDRAATVAWSRGIGLYALDSTVVWSDGMVAGNQASSSAAGGSIYGGGLFLDGGESDLGALRIVDNAANGTRTGIGGGIVLGAGSDLVLTNSIIASNTAGVGATTGAAGGLYLGLYTSSTITNCDFVENIAGGSSSSYGGAIHGNYAGDVVMVNTNIVSNQATYGGAMGTTYTGYYSGEDVSYSNFYDNGASAFSGFHDPTGGSGNIKKDPAFGDVSATLASAWDLTLSAGSACIDAGHPDIEDADGTRSDIGSFGGPKGDW